MICIVLVAAIVACVIVNAVINGYATYTGSNLHGVAFDYYLAFYLVILSLVLLYRDFNRPDSTDALNDPLEPRTISVPQMPPMIPNEVNALYLLSNLNKQEHEYVGLENKEMINLYIGKVLVNDSIFNKMGLDDRFALYHQLLRSHILIPENKATVRSLLNKALQELMKKQN